MEAGIRVSESEPKPGPSTRLEPLPGPSTRLDPLPILTPPRVLDDTLPVFLPPPLSRAPPLVRECRCDTDEPEHNIMHLADRILLATWLVFLEMILVVLSSFYLWSFFNVGVPSSAVMFSYWILLIYCSGLFMAFIFGIVGLRRTRLGDFKAMLVAYNTSLGIVILFSMAIILLFSQQVPRADILKYVTKPHLGSETFVNYIHSRFDCCVVMTPEQFESSDYNFDMLATGTTASPEEIAATFSLCPQDGRHNESCFANNVELLAQLLTKDGQAYTIFMLQTYLPTILLVGVAVLMCLLNHYCYYAREIDQARGNLRTAIVPRSFSPNSFASMVCAGFARYSGTLTPSVPSVIPLPPQGTRSPFPAPGPIERPTPIKSCMMACTRERLKEVIPLKDLMPKTKKKVTIAQEHEPGTHGDYEESGPI